jgi:hypothetical protein
MRGDPWYGRPARCARRRAIIGSPTFTYLPRCLLTSKTHAALSHTVHTACSTTRRMARAVPPHDNMWGPPFTSKSKPEVDYHLLHLPRKILLAFRRCCPFLHLLRVQNQVGGGSFDGVASSTSLACKSESEVDRSHVLTPFIPPRELEWPILWF